MINKIFILFITYNLNIKYSEFYIIIFLNKKFKKKNEFFFQFNKNNNNLF